VRRPPLRDAGMVTAETAVVLPALVLVFATLIGVLSAETAQIRCVDAAGLGARAAATGQSLDAVTAGVRRTLPGANVSMTTSGGLVTVNVSAAVPHLPALLGGLRVQESATAAVSTPR